MLLLLLLLCLLVFYTLLCVPISVSTESSETEQQKSKQKGEFGRTEMIATRRAREIRQNRRHGIRISLFLQPADKKVPVWLPILRTARSTLRQHDILEAPPAPRKVIRKMNDREIARRKPRLVSIFNLCIFVSCSCKGELFPKKSDVLEIARRAPCAGDDPVNGLGEFDTAENPSYHARGACVGWRPTGKTCRMIQQAKKERTTYLPS